MDFRTDLAVERREILGRKNIDGVEIHTRKFENTTVNEIKITNNAGASVLGKPVGRYITIDVPPFSHSAELLDGRLNAVISEIKSLLPDKGTVLVAGLGNSDITSDGLGPECAKNIFATRHISEELAKSAGLNNLRSVCAVETGVLGKTGFEAFEIIKGLCHTVKPDTVIVIDALAARQLSRLGNTVQLSDNGIFPGSGVGNRRSEISKNTLGTQVISVGVPTVINGITLAREILGDYESEALSQYSDLTVSPKESDLIIKRGARLIALGINCALQSEISPTEMLSLMND